MPKPKPMSKQTGADYDSSKIRDFFNVVPSESPTSSEKHLQAGSTHSPGEPETVVQAQSRPGSAVSTNTYSRGPAYPDVFETDDLEPRN